MKREEKQEQENRPRGGQPVILEKPPEPQESQAIIINEVQLLLAEKRTSLAVMRTGITVFVLPMSVLSLLVVTSRYYDLSRVMHFFLPLLLINIALLVLGGYLIVRSSIRLHHQDRLISELKQKNAILSRLID